MKKTINSKIFKLLSILLFSCLFGIFVKNDAFATESHIMVYSNIYNASSVIDAEFNYQITPDSSNPSGATGEPTELKISFNDVSPAGNQTTVAGKIDFSNTVYQKPEIYKYTVSEVSSSNPDYAVSSEKYEIYVIATNTGVEVYQQAKNLNDDTKGNINFNHEPIYSFTTINLTVHGDAVDKQEYFRFIVNVDSLCIGCKYDMLGQDEYVKFNGQSVKTSDYYTVEGVVAALTPINRTPNYIYLKDGQSMTIGLTSDGKSQIPLGTKITVMADSNLDERKWTMYVDGVETQTFEHYVGRDIDFDILLERNMLVPNTGLLYEVLPFVVLVLFAFGGLVLFTKIKVSDAK